MPSAHEGDAQVVDVGAGRAGDQQVAERGEEGMTALRGPLACRVLARPCGAPQGVDIVRIRFDNN